MNQTLHRFTTDAGWDHPLDASLDSSQTLVLVFGPSEREPVQGAMDAVRATYPQSAILGCSTAGEIHGPEVRDGTLSVAVARFASTTLRQATARVTSAEETLFAGQAIASQLAGEQLKAVLVLSDGLDVNGSKLARSFLPMLDEGVVVTGGLAGDGSRFEKTWVMTDKAAGANLVSAVGFYGDDFRVTHGSRGGWDVLNAELEVTHAIGNVVYELNAQPALQVYKSYLGDQAEELPSSGLLYPIAIRNEEEEDGWTVRTILGVNEEEQSITFAGDVPDGIQAQLMQANFDRVIDGARTASELATANVVDADSMLAVAISCVGRRLVLGDRTQEELAAAIEQYPPGTQQVGFYSYGELSPLASGRCSLHNQTMTLTLFGERAGVPA